MIQIQKGDLEMLNELLCDPLGTLEKQNVVICALTRLSKQVRHSRYHSRFFDCLAHPNLSATLATDQKCPLSHLCISYQSLAVSLTIVLISGISTMVNGTLLNFGKRYEDNLRVIFDQWPKLHLGLDALSNQKTLNGIYYTIKVIIWNLDHVS